MEVLIAFARQFPRQGMDAVQSPRNTNRFILRKRRARLSQFSQSRFLCHAWLRILACYSSRNESVALQILVPPAELVEQAMDVVPGNSHPVGGKLWIAYGLDSVVVLNRQQPSGRAGRRETAGESGFVRPADQNVIGEQDAGQRPALPLSNATRSGTTRRHGVSRLFIFTTVTVKESRYEYYF